MTKADDLQRYYELVQQLRVLESEKATLRDTLVRRHGTGISRVGRWLLTVNSFTVNRFNREAAEAELGSLARFEKPTASLRVDVKPTSETLLELLESHP